MFINCGQFQMCRVFFETHGSIFHQKLTCSTELGVGRGGIHLFRANKNGDQERVARNRLNFVVELTRDFSMGCQVSRCNFHPIHAITHTKYVFNHTKPILYHTQWISSRRNVNCVREMIFCGTKWILIRPIKLHFVTKKCNFVIKILFVLYKINFVPYKIHFVDAINISSWWNPLCKVQYGFCMVKNTFCVRNGMNWAKITPWHLAFHRKILS